mmetsp:Transcript_1392/g.3230  ORF Transcript_1392/g.3230 Transcript_1392/m.3230 type:complete len:447 (+) Transcript_1392:1196-2536(+)
MALTLVFMLGVFSANLPVRFLPATAIGFIRFNAARCAVADVICECEWEENAGWFAVVLVAAPTTSPDAGRMAPTPALPQPKCSCGEPDGSVETDILGTAPPPPAAAPGPLIRTDFVFTRTEASCTSSRRWRSIICCSAFSRPTSLSRSARSCTIFEWVCFASSRISHPSRYICSTCFRRDSTFSARSFTLATSSSNLAFSPANDFRSPSNLSSFSKKSRRFSSNLSISSSRFLRSPAMSTSDSLILRSQFERALSMEVSSAFSRSSFFSRFTLSFFTASVSSARRRSNTRFSSSSFCRSSRCDSWTLAFSSRRDRCSSSRRACSRSSLSFATTSLSLLSFTCSFSSASMRLIKSVIFLLCVSTSFDEPSSCFSFAKICFSRASNASSRILSSTERPDSSFFWSKSSWKAESCTFSIKEFSCMPEPAERRTESNSLSVDSRITATCL